MRPCDLILFCGRFGILWAIFFAILAAPPEPSNLHRNITGPVPKTAALTHTHARTQILQLKRPNQRHTQMSLNIGLLVNQIAISQKMSHVFLREVIYLL